MPAFAELAAQAEPPLDRLSLALAAEFRPVDEDAALTVLDRLGSELADLVRRGAGTPEDEAAACGALLGGVHGFRGDTDQYDDPANSMLDVVLERRRGLPILLSVVYVAVGERAGVPLRGVGLPGHYVVGHFGLAAAPLLLDPFNGGTRMETDAAPSLVRPWGAHATAMRMLNNLLGAYQRRGDLGRALTAASLRLQLPADDDAREELEVELRAMQARLN